MTSFRFLVQDSATISARFLLTARCTSGIKPASVFNITGINVVAT